MTGIVISGGGIGGLALAGLLRAAGRDVVVRERADGLPDGGTTLGMWPAAMRVLDDLGVGDRVRDEAVRQRAGELRRPDGRLVARVGLRTDVWLVNRPALLRALAEAAGGIEYANPVTDWRAALGDAALLVGADGVHSAVRAAISTAPVRRPGATIWRGTADLPQLDAVETWGPGALFGMTPRPGGLTNWFALWRRPPGTAPQELPGFFAGWHRQVRDVIEATDAASTIRHEAVLAPRLPRYTAPQERVAVLGDAAHAMMPNLGRGACETLVDAGSLASALLVDDVTDALARYDRDRRRAAGRVVTASAVMARLATASRGRGLRDQILRGATRFA